MGPKRISRREAIVGTIAAAALGGRPAVARGNMAKPSTLPPGNGDGQLGAVNAILRGYGGKAPIGTTFNETLGLKKRAAERLAAQRPITTGASAELVLFRIWMRDGNDPIKAIEAEFLKAARWLLKRPEGAFERWREQGRVADVLVALHIKSTQHGRIDGHPNQLVVPPRFMLACSGAGLPVVLSLYA